MRIKVAIVDDDEGIRASLATLINRASDMKLTGIRTPRRAGAAILRDPPDVVLMDINMPGMKGVEW